MACVLGCLMFISCADALPHRGLQSRPELQSRRELQYCRSCSDHGSRSWWGALTRSACDCAEGWSGPCCNLPDGHHDGTFILKRIANDKVSDELAWAKDGSDLPESLRGIFWMDQRGVHPDIKNRLLKNDPHYTQVGSTAADELLVTFGEAEWDEQTRCAGRVPVFGGHRGHWTYMDQGTHGAPKSDIFDTTIGSRLNLKFCFRDHNMDHIDIHNYIKISSVVEGVGLSLPETWDGYFEIPMWIMHLSMVKKPWGWDRVTTVLDLTQARLLKSFLPSWLDLEPLGGEAHYPVFPIVDGAGQQTEHWPHYLAWANDPSSWSGYNCTNGAPPNSFGSTSSTFTCPSNNGDGTQLVGVLAQ